MRFTIRTGSDPTATADRAMLAAIGLPAGGVVSIGESHARVLPGRVPVATTLLVGPATLANAGVAAGSTVDVKRVMLPTAATVVVEPMPADVRGVVSALVGLPVTPGDEVTVDAARLPEETEAVTFAVRAVTPGPAGVVGPGTMLSDTLPMPDESPDDRSEATQTPTEPSTPPDDGGHRPPTRSEALLTGLDEEVETLSGWIRLLAGKGNLPTAWGLPEVAGVIVEAPPGCGGPEVVAEAARQAGAHRRDVSLDLVFKPTRLLDLLEAAIRDTPRPGVIHLEPLETIAGEDGLSNYRTQVGAVLRWFLDKVARTPGLATVIGVRSVAGVDPSVTGSELLPRTLRIPPPDSARRTALFDAATGRIPRGDVDFELLGARSAGFSGADILAAVVHASAMVSDGGELDTETLLTALAETNPTLGATGLGEIPSFGFEAVAGLADVKQRLTEAVIWPMTQPERFARLGIDPPGGILLWGPPGTGKTFVVKALANEAGAAFFPVKGAELLDKYVGESERAVRDVFARARAAAPSILFFDELDALAPIRGSSTTSVTDSVVASLLTELDGVTGRGELVAIGATNRRDLIDPALLRSGRFEVHIHLALPDRSARLALLRITDVPLDDDVSLDDLADATEGLSFADLTGLLREAALVALRTDAHALEVTWEHLEEALDAFADRDLE